MLCPDISDFPPPKVYTYQKQNESDEATLHLLKMNDFYKSVIITVPDTHNTQSIQDIIKDDTEYYKITNLNLKEFIDHNFIGYFIKNGHVTALSADRSCIVDNCAAISRDGILTLNILEFVYQTLGLQGTKRPHGFYQIKIDLRNIPQFEKTRDAIAKLEEFDFYMIWEPHDDKVCPSSIARYFWDKKAGVQEHSMTIENVLPQVIQTPTLLETDIVEVVEWMGMLANKANILPDDPSISTYIEPESEIAIESDKIAVVIAKGFITPYIIFNLFNRIKKLVTFRGNRRFWIAMSLQAYEESLWQFPGCPKVFLSHNTSTNIFQTPAGCHIYLAGELKYL